MFYRVTLCSAMGMLFFAPYFHAFTLTPPPPPRFATTLNMSSRSRLQGNQREPTQQEIAIMDEMIDKLANAKPYELPNAVRRAFRVVSSPQFFLRIASRTDTAASNEEKEKLAALASNLVSTLDVVVETTEEQLDERAAQVQQVVAAAAEPDSGEFLVPLLPERLQSMREELKKLEEAYLDEGFLSTLDAWMNKSQQDGMDLMVGILQKVLQMYAGLQIARSRERKMDFDKDDAAEQLLTILLEQDADEWDSTIRASSASSTDLMKAVQRTTEKIVLQLEAGSMSQRVQAEYLQELMKRVNSSKK
ncbi:hypothetical protein FisN_12Hh027 [Fistulifera solaris]|uniref:Uncharacterized protein n=1 Tax=Fistulifera solaris TaxID=1519565 RepID=A0A1Z5K212_FISSO|nr:hypothetical protein FisN_12Hh027 [Fistulifera solaris]|eukprot:GAX20182.1 hypothetical protein FisN_12Hh027 [Fistulifera solaris]